jgi:hypothetical protein
MGIANMVLRTVYISPSVDDALRDEAFKKRTSKNDLIRQYIELGMEAKRAGSGRRPASSASTAVAGHAVAAKKVAAKRSVAAKKRVSAGQVVARAR